MMNIIQKKSWFVWSLLLLFILTPLSFDLNSAAISVTSAFAKSGNNGGGNGGGNGHGGGDSHGQSSAEVDHGNTHEHSHSHGLGLGQDKQGYASGKSKGFNSSKLGRLNAAHASATARENAAPHSAVGRVAAYEAAVYERQGLQLELQALEAQEALTPQQFEDIEDTRAAVAAAAQLEVETLAAATNKNIDETVVQAVNELLGIEPLESTQEVTSTIL